MKTLEYLDLAKCKLKIQSDYALAKALKVKQPTISSYRSGRSRMDNDVAVKIAAILEIEPMEVIAAASLERAKTEELRQIWSGLLDKMSKGFKILLSGADPRGA